MNIVQRIELEKVETRNSRPHRTCRLACSPSPTDGTGLEVPRGRGARPPAPASLAVRSAHTHSIDTSRPSSPRTRGRRSDARGICRVCTYPSHGSVPPALSDCSTHDSRATQSDLRSTHTPTLAHTKSSAHERSSPTRSDQAHLRLGRAPRSTPCSTTTVPPSRYPRSRVLAL